MIAEIIFIIGSKIAFPLDVIPPDLIKSKGIAEILDIGADGTVISFKMLFGKSSSDTSGRGQV